MQLTRRGESNQDERLRRLEKAFRQQPQRDRLFSAIESLNGLVQGMQRVLQNPTGRLDDGRAEHLLKLIDRLPDATSSVQVAGREFGAQLREALAE